jgi:vacuolar-type H+-ATPase subunit I/STV1
MARRLPSVSDINKMKRDEMKDLLIAMKNDDMREMLSEVLDGVRSLREEKDAMRIEIDELKKENQHITEILEKQQAFLDRLDYERRSRNLIISGLPEEDAGTANDREKLQEIFSKLDGSVAAALIDQLRQTRKKRTTTPGHHSNFGLHRNEGAVGQEHCCSEGNTRLRQRFC